MARTVVTNGSAPGGRTCSFTFVTTFWLLMTVPVRRDSSTSAVAADTDPLDPFAHPVPHEPHHDQRDRGGEVDESPRPEPEEADRERERDHGDGERLREA